MPWKYLRITRRRPCDTLLILERGQMTLSRLKEIKPADFFEIHKAAEQAGNYAKKT